MRPLIGVAFGHLARNVDAGVGKEDIHAPKMRHTLFHHRHNLSADSDIGGKR